jgi:5-methylcytosine-specific restriction endonuclease McrA
VLNFEPGVSTHGHALYSDVRWRALRAEFVARFGETCMDRHHDPQHPRTKASGAKIELDHIQEVKDGGKPFDRANLMLRCRRCHKRKTDQVENDRNERAYYERRLRMKAGIVEGNDGEPIKDC